MAQSTGMLSDIFSCLYNINMELQGLSINIFYVHKKITAILKKMEQFQFKIWFNDVFAFTALESILSDNDLILTDLNV